MDMPSSTGWKGEGAEEAGVERLAAGYDGRNVRNLRNPGVSKAQR